MTKKLYAKRVAGGLYELRDGASVVLLTRSQLEAEARSMGAKEVHINQAEAHGVGEPNETVWTVMKGETG